MKKILFHINSMEQGGAERVVSNLANNLCKDDYEIVIATEWQKDNEFYLEPEIKRVHVGLRKEDESKSRIKILLLRIKYLRDCIKREKPDIVIAFCHKANYRALMAAWGIKVPVMISCRTDPVGHYDTKQDKVALPLLIPRVDGCVFQTEGQRDFFPKKLQQKSRIILNPVNDKYLNVEEPSIKEKVIVQSGRIVDFKNQPMLIDAFMKVHDKYPEYQLKIYGPDSHDGTKEILEKKIADYKATDFIHLMGGSDSLEKEIPKAEIYAFSSDWEGLPNALIEAMVLGMPIVATDCPCGGPRTIMTDGVDGLLVPIKNADAFAQGLIKLIEDKELANKLGNNARKLSDKVKSNAVIACWKDYIKELIDK